MNVGTSSVKQTERTRVMIVDPTWHLGLKLADCLATGGYHAILVRNLDSMLAELNQIQPEAILLSSASRAEQHNAIRALHCLYPKVSVLSLSHAGKEGTALATPQPASRETQPLPSPRHRVEEWIRASLGMPCVRVQ